MNGFVLPRWALVKFDGGTGLWPVRVLAQAGRLCHQFSDKRIVRGKVVGRGGVELDELVLLQTPGGFRIDGIAVAGEFLRFLTVAAR